MFTWTPHEEYESCLANHSHPATDEEGELSTITNKLSSHGGKHDTIKDKAFWSHIIKQIREGLACNISFFFFFLGNSGKKEEKAKLLKNVERIMQTLQQKVGKKLGPCWDTDSCYIPSNVPGNFWEVVFRSDI